MPNQRSWSSTRIRALHVHRPRHRAPNRPSRPLVGGGRQYGALSRRAEPGSGFGRPAGGGRRERCRAHGHPHAQAWPGARTLSLKAIAPTRFWPSRRMRAAVYLVPKVIEVSPWRVLASRNAQDLRARRTCAVEHAQRALAGARARAQLNAFITPDENGLTAAAQRADAQLAAGARSTLAGIPFAHKDIFCTNAVRTTCASRMLEHFVPPYDAGVVERLNQAHAVAIGKTNMDEFAMGSSTRTAHSGRCVILGTRRACRAAHRAVPPPLSHPASCRSRPAPTPGAQSASRPLFAALPASNPPTAAFRAGA